MLAIGKLFLLDCEALPSYFIVIVRSLSVIRVLFIVSIYYFRLQMPILVQLLLSSCYWSDLGFAWPGRIHQPDFFQGSRIRWLRLNRSASQGYCPAGCILRWIYFLIRWAIQWYTDNESLLCLLHESKLNIEHHWYDISYQDSFGCCGQSHWKITGVQNERNIVFFVGGRKLLELSRIIAAAWW